MNANAIRQYYLEQSPMSDPGELGHLFSDLPADVSQPW